MIDQFGKVMLYVADPRRVADFWVNQLGFTEVTAQDLNGAVLSVEVAHAPGSGAALVIFDRAVAAQMSPELDLGTPSILFGSRDVTSMRAQLEQAGVAVGDLVEHGGRLTFNFSDPENHWFAVEQIA